MFLIKLHRVICTGFTNPGGVFLNCIMVQLKYCLVDMNVTYLNAWGSHSFYLYHGLKTYNHSFFRHATNILLEKQQYFL